MDTLTVDIETTLQETKQFVDNYKKVKEELDIENKQLKELSLSYDTITKYMGECDLNHIANLVAAKKSAVLTLSQKHSSDNSVLAGKKLACIDLIKKLHDLYLLLEKQEDFTETADQDPFIVEMRKLIYPNTVDNQQLREDPPIAGIFKNKTSLVTASNASEIHLASVKTIDISASASKPWGGFKPIV